MPATPPSSTAGWVAWLVAALVAGGGLKLGYDVFFGRSDRRKVRAEGSVLVLESANRIAQDALDQVAEMSTAFREYRQADERRWNLLGQQLRKHDGWDRRVVARLEAATGEAVEPPPPLYVDDQS